MVAAKNHYSDLNRMILSISGTCNLRCSYCYAHYGDFKRDNRPMTYEIGKRGIDLLCKHVKEMGGKKLSLVFMGGEPLLQWELLKRLVSYAKRRTKRFSLKLGLSISTNGTLLDKKKADYLKQNRFIVLVSIDGKNHDRFRFDAKGRGTYNTIIKNVTHLKKGFRKQLVLRSTFSKQNRDLFDFYTNFEIRPNRHTELLMVPIISNDPQFKMDDASVKSYKRQLRKYANHLISQWRKGNYIPIPTNLSALADRADAQFREKPCIGQSIVLGANGSFYSCPILALHNEFKVGDVIKGIDWSAMTNIKNKMDPMLNETCRTCTFLSRCGGGCYANCLIEMGNATKVNPNYCSILKYEFKIAQLLAREAERIEAQ